ncbi:hypothetical protein EK21DRAFT_110374 [Setomelanomma holmii]|uniref:BTB domain-containing protein n=1 Tax=Setomelanomma holmii TaxID=210430 RepID=A0A9P4HEM8_9PLEO|nr:hypothetical protein EK21DRAFT_110374 [Setomelanomma holmii]
MPSALHKTPSNNFYDGPLHTVMFLDIMIDLGTRKHPGQTSILIKKSTWFQKHCPGRKEIELIRPSPELLEHFSFQNCVEDQFEHGFRLMIAYYYIGRFPIHLLVGLLAHTYGIDGLIQYSAQHAESLADALREEDSMVFLRLIEMIMEYKDWPSDDPWKKLATKHVRIIVKEEGAK